MSEVPVCDVCGKPAHVFVCYAAGTVGGGRESKSVATTSEKFCEECAVTKGVEKEGFNQPKAYIPEMAEQLAGILSAPQTLRDLMNNPKIPMPPHMQRLMQSGGYNTDFSPPSLWEIDRFYNDHCEHGVVKIDVPFARNFEREIVSVGFYIGEVARRHLDGEWVTDYYEAPGAEFNFAVRLPNDVLCWPVQRAMQRFRLGPAESIVDWGLALGLLVGARPEPKK